MPEKDAAEKYLEGFNDVFADIINGVVFKGKQVVKATALTDATTSAMYKAEGTIHEEDRDVAKFWNESFFKVTCFGFENQSAVNPDEPLVVIGYDGAAYKNQVDTDKTVNDEGKRQRYPVISIVLYFGDEPWNTNKTLRERLTFPDWTEYPEGTEDDYMEFFNDYKVNLVEITKMTDEEIMTRFHGDFRVVAYHFKHWTEPGYKALDQDLVHVDAVLKMIAVMSGDDAYEKVIVRGRRPRKLNEYVKKMRQSQRIMGAVEYMRLKGYKDDKIISELMSSYEGLTEDDAKSYIAMADEEMKGVTA